jgi:hypothetical protein
MGRFILRTVIVARGRDAEERDVEPALRIALVTPGMS